MDKEKLLRAYRNAELDFDELLNALLRSPWSLALFLGWTVFWLALGMWISA